MHEEETKLTPEETPSEETATSPGSKWVKGMASPNPAGRPKQPRTVKEVRELARQHTVQMVEVLARVANNPKSPPAARQAAASSLLDRAWGKPASFDLEGADQLVIQVVKFNNPQLNDDSNMKLIEGEVERNDDENT
jgi:hypothetical protein